MVVGQTKDVGFNIGVSKTLPLPLGAVWDFVVSPEGAVLWLGEGVPFPAKKGEAYETTDGTAGEIRSFHERDRVRLTWRPRDWDHDTTVQVAVTGGAEKTVLRFHQEWLADSTERARQREHWRGVMERVAKTLLESGKPQK